jgi:hypothetical protein
MGYAHYHLTEHGEQGFDVRFVHCIRKAVHVQVSAWRTYHTESKWLKTDINN